jgi:NADH-quinone oxidoreductase E subunit
VPTIRIQSPQTAGQTPKAQGLRLVWGKDAKTGITDILKRYPHDRSRSALIPLLWIAQREFGGWLSVDAMQLVADTLNLPYIRVYEVASFYTMFNLNPVGKYHVQVCGNCSCLIRGSDEVFRVIKEELGLKPGETSQDGLFTLTEVECLGACVAAPMLQTTAADGPVHYVTHLTPQKVKTLIQALQKDDAVALAKLVDTPPAGVDPISRQGYGR